MKMRIAAAAASPGVAVPARTPRDIIAKLDADIQKALGYQEVKDRLLAVGGFVTGGGPAELAARVELRDRGNSVKQTIAYNELAAVTIQKKIMGPTLLVQSRAGATTA